MTRISAIGIALLCILCVTSCGLKSRQTTTESSSETGYSPVTTDTAATIVPCYAKGYTVKYLPHHVRLVDIHDPQKESSSTFHYALVPKGIKPVGIPSDYTVIETPVEHVMCMTSLQLSNFIRLDACDYVVGITSTRHLFNKEMNDRLKSGETVKIGIEGNFDNEVIMSMKPDVIFISPFKRGRLLVISCSGVLVAIVTAYCGPIMFIGLAVPHLCRAIFHSSDHRVLMPATLLVGASLALVCNLIARMPGFEGALPVNSVTALVGAPVVASVLFRKRKGELNE